ncbi:hypothetical protein O181_069424 [Austropuccinia psidii MF-1]|uniref:Uncharacterized protein n=1 Tax=Austropuccinia psidii MF-1 TaxID=1389203 RepID=A0A9Q3EYV0_9BASI|nr:hypothetical protein [Austropuccinia psidii MF-1]
MPWEQTLRQPTPGLSCTKWLQDLFHEPSQYNEPPIPGQSPSSKPHEDISACELEPEVPMTQPLEELFELPEKIPLFILDSNKSPALFITHYTKWVVDLPSFPSFEWDLFIIDSPKGEDLILGYDFLYHFNPIIDWKNGLITYEPIHKDSSGILPSASNDFATAFNSVSLAGELKTPSLPSSVHIPSIIHSQ